MAVVAASGSGAVIVYSFLIMEPNEYLRLLSSSDKKDKIVVVVEKNEGVVHKEKYYTYITTYGGFTVITRTRKPLPLPSDTKTIKAKEIILPVAVREKLSKIKT